MVKVIYTIKNENNYLVDKVKKFDLLQEAFSFVRELNANPKLMGKPIVERN
jgi:ribosomal protein S2